MTTTLDLPVAVSDDLVAPALAALPQTGNADTDAAVRVAVIGLAAAVYQRGLDDAKPVVAVADFGPRVAPGDGFFVSNANAFNAGTALLPTREEIAAIARAAALEVLEQQRAAAVPPARRGTRG